MEFEGIEEQSELTGISGRRREFLVVEELLLRYSPIVVVSKSLSRGSDTMTMEDYCRKNSSTTRDPDEFRLLFDPFEFYKLIFVLMVTRVGDVKVLFRAREKRNAGVQRQEESLASSTCL